MVYSDIVLRDFLFLFCCNSYTEKNNLQVFIIEKDMQMHFYSGKILLIERDFVKTEKVLNELSKEKIDDNLIYQVTTLH